MKKLILFLLVFTVQPVFGGSDGDSNKKAPDNIVTRILNAVDTMDKFEQQQIVWLLSAPKQSDAEKYKIRDLLAAMDDGKNNGKNWSLNLMMR